MRRGTQFAFAIVAFFSAIGMAHAQFRVDESTGQANYRYEFPLPAARGRFQPTLSLFYGGYSGAPGPDTGYGSGWTSSVPRIMKVGENGATHYYYNEGGSTKPLIPSPRDGSGRYVVDVEERYLSFRQFVLSTWYATDGNGNEYEFDQLPVGDDYWLTRVKDVDGNEVFFNHQGTMKGMVLGSITYNAYDPNSPGSTERAPPRTTSTVYATTVAVDFNYSTQLIANVRIQNMGSQGLVTVRRYEVKHQDYATDTGSVSNLVSIQEFGKEVGRSLAPTAFDYVGGGFMNAATTSSGVHYAVTFINPVAFGPTSLGAYLVVRTLTVSGPALVTQTTTYWYKGSTTTAGNWFNGAQDFRGYAQSWWQSDADNIVVAVWWEVGSHAFTGVAAQKEWAVPSAGGTRSDPPTYLPSGVFRREIAEHAARSIASGTCTALTSTPGTPNTASEVANTMYPVTTFTSRIRTSILIDSHEIASEATVSCGDVDSYGHILARKMDPDVLRSGDESMQRTSYVIATTATTACVDCIDRTFVTDTSATQGLFASTRFAYDAAWHVNAVFATDQPNHEVAVYNCTYNGNGTLASKVEGTITTTFKYGAFGASTNEYQVRLTRLTTSEGTKSLVTDYAYDDFGYQTLVSGPYVQGSTAARLQKGMAYDDLGRLRLIARSPVAPGGSIAGAIAALSYSDYAPAATPPVAIASVTKYVFAVPLTYPDGSIPQTPDVQQSTAYLDGFGRALQTRERLGGTGTSDLSANISQNLSNYRVSAAVVYDAAGRVVAQIEPFYSSTAAFVDYRSSAVDNLTGATAVHVTLQAYDGSGREICRAYQPLASNSVIPAPPANCRSSFAENSGYMLAVATRYRGLTDAGINMIGIKTIPAENNLATTSEGFAPDGPELFYDASGHVVVTTTLDERRAATDLNHNKTTYTYDAMGLLRSIAREVSGSARPPVTTTIKYDMMGRATLRIDPNVGLRESTYDSQGRVLTIQLSPHPLGNGVTGRDEIHFAYDLGRPAGKDICTAVPSGSAQQLDCVHETWFYDAPYQADASYQYVAGRVSYVTNDLTTVAFGYTPEGTIAKRAQQIAGVPGTFVLANSTLADGQRVQTDLSSQYGNSSYRLSYDSMRRPVHASSGPTTFWDTASAASTGAYDPLGRVGAFTADNSSVQASWQYGAFSGLESSARVTVGASDVYNLTSEVYQGSKLASCTDQVAQTSYRYWYNDAGQLRGANATPFGGSSLAQSARLCMTYNTSKSYSSGPSLGNLERVRNQSSSTAIVETYSYPNAAGASWPDTPDHVYSPSPASTTGNVIVHDFGGRVSSKSSTAEAFQYDPLARLTQVTRNSVVAEVVRYDPMGNIVGRLSGATLTYYLGGEATVAAAVPSGCAALGCSVDPASVKVDLHVLVGARRIASVRVLALSIGRILYYHRNRLGSVVATSLAGGAVGAKYAWGVHGDLFTVLDETVDAASEIGFSGSLRFTGGLLLMGRRVYDPKLRQFLQPDAIDPMTYTYAGGDPVNFIDPSGMMAIRPDTRDYISERSPAARTGRTCYFFPGENEPYLCNDWRDPDGPAGPVSSPGREDHYHNPRAWQNNGGGQVLGVRSSALGPIQITTRGWSSRIRSVLVGAWILGNFFVGSGSELMALGPDSAAADEYRNMATYQTRLAQYIAMQTAGEPLKPWSTWLPGGTDLVDAPLATAVLGTVSLDFVPDSPPNGSVNAIVSNVTSITSFARGFGFSASGFFGFELPSYSRLPWSPITPLGNINQIVYWSETLR